MEGMEQAAGAAGEFNTGILVVMIAFLVVLLAVAWLIRWLGGKTGRIRGRYLKIIDSIYLGPNRGLHLVLVAGRLFLVGLADRYVRLLAEIDDSTFLEKVTKKGEGSPFQHNGGFSHYLQRFLSPGAGREKKEEDNEPAVRKVREKITEFRNHPYGREDE